VAFSSVPFLIERNVLIDVSRGNAGAIQCVDRLAEPWALSQVTAVDLIVEPDLWGTTVESAHLQSDCFRLCATGPPWVID
jgi:hypothetical protein